jgi:hypothetical protein
MSAPSRLVRLSGVSSASVEWLWQPYLARGKLAILDGDPGTGKSFLTVDLAARLSRGGPLPDGSVLARRHATLLLNAEDDLADTVRPRLVAAGADLDAVYSLGGVGRSAVRLPADLPEVEGVVREAKIDLVVIDPMMAFFPPEVSVSNDQSIRQALTPLADLAARSQAAILLVRHLNKSGGHRAIYRGSGSIGILGAIRTALLLARHPDDPDQRLLAMTKTNLGPVGTTLALRLALGPAGPGVQWLGTSDRTADDLCRPLEDLAEAGKLTAATAWLKETLARGPVRASKILTAAAELGHSRRTVERAKKELGIVSEKTGQREWTWSDPTVPPPRLESFLKKIPEESAQVSAEIARTLAEYSDDRGDF